MSWAVTLNSISSPTRNNCGSCFRWLDCANQSIDVIPDSCQLTTVLPPVHASVSTCLSRLASIICSYKFQQMAHLFLLSPQVTPGCVRWRSYQRNALDNLDSHFFERAEFLGIV